MNDILRIGKVVYRVSDTEVLEVGTLTKELTNNIEMVYVLDIDKKRIDRLKERGIDVGVLLMPGVDLDDGYRKYLIRYHSSCLLGYRIGVGRT